MENSALEELVYELVERVNKLEQHNNEHHTRERVSGKAYQAKAMAGWDMVNNYWPDPYHRLRPTPEYLRQATANTTPVEQTPMERMI